MLSLVTPLAVILMTMAVPKPVHRESSPQGLS
jgi:hypothetical protein